jgi:hypothetical protein
LEWEGLSTEGPMDKRLRKKSYLKVLQKHSETVIWQSEECHIEARKAQDFLKFLIWQLKA